MSPYQRTFPWPISHHSLSPPLVVFFFLALIIVWRIIYVFVYCVSPLQPQLEYQVQEGRYFCLFLFTVLSTRGRAVPGTQQTLNKYLLMEWLNSSPGRVRGGERRTGEMGYWIGKDFSSSIVKQEGTALSFYTRHLPQRKRHKGPHS